MAIVMQTPALGANMFYQTFPDIGDAAKQREASVQVADTQPTSAVLNGASRVPNRF